MNTQAHSIVIVDHDSNRREKVDESLFVDGVHVIKSMIQKTVNQWVKNSSHSNFNRNTSIAS